MKITEKGLNLASAAKVVAALLTLGLLAGCGPKRSAPPPAPPKPPSAAAPADKATNAVAGDTNQISSEFISYFDDRLPPENNGKDPFFPVSDRRKPNKVEETAPGVPVHVDPVLVLKYVSISRTRSLVVINSETLSPGETASVRLPDGSKVRVTCKEIVNDHEVRVTVEGEPGVKTLTMKP